jgi:hypothetical protein
MTGCDYLERSGLAADPAAALTDRHVAGCDSCRRAAASMAWIADAVPRLVARERPPAGWEARVLAAIAPPAVPVRQRRGWRRWLAAPAVAVAAAAGALLAVGGRGAPALALAVDVEPGPVAMRGGASIGDVVRVTGGGGGRHRALWIYRDGRHVELACPERASGAGVAGCQVGDGRIEATFSPRVAARFDIVLLASDGPIPAPTGSLDASVAAALRAGADHRVDHLVVR